jgi:hypothetical protein
MTYLLVSAVFGSFVMVRLFKGPWGRNPHYLAAAIAGSVAGTLLLHAFWPALDGDFIAGGIVGIAGPIAGIMLFDTLLGMA